MVRCKLCETRRPRRFCPGVRGDICTLCCGTHREETVDCPLDCVYLQDARKHERREPADAEQQPNQDIRVSEDFVRERSELFLFTGRTLLQAAFETPGAVDYDIRETLEALIRTYRTLESGLVYETRPSNLVAASIQQRVRQTVDQHRQQLRERLGMETTRDTDVLGILVFFQRLEHAYNNGRKRGRAFLDFLREYFAGDGDAPGPHGRVAASGSSLIVP